MNNEAKQVVENLRDYIRRYADPYSCANPIAGSAEIMRDAADAIERLSADLERVIDDDNFQRKQVTDLYAQLSQRIHDRDTWQRRAEAAERALVGEYAVCANEI